MNIALKSALLAAACLAATGCESNTFNETMDTIRGANPFADREAAETETEAPATEMDEVVEAAADPAPAAPAVQPTQTGPSLATYDMPVGGGNTISLSVAQCLEGCPFVNVMLDPDNYWQRTAPEAITQGEGADGLYNRVMNAFQGNGFYSFQGQINVIPGEEKTCPDYDAAGQVFLISLSRNSGRRVIAYDTGCQGSASSEAAASAVNALVDQRDYMDIVSGLNTEPAQAEE